MATGTLYNFATDIQIQAHRIVSLAEALDDALDFSTSDESVRAALGRALDYVNLLQEAAEKAKSAGEQVEVLALRSRLQ